MTWDKVQFVPVLLAKVRTGPLQCGPLPFLIQERQSGFPCQLVPQLMNSR